MLLGQENHSRPVFACWRQLHALSHHLSAVKLVRDLDQDPGAIAHQLVCADRATMVEVFEDLQSLLNDTVRSLALDVRHEPDPAGIMFIGQPVQAVFCKVFDLLLRSRCQCRLVCHGVLQNSTRKSPTVMHCSDCFKVK